MPLPSVARNCIALRNTAWCALGLVLAAISPAWGQYDVPYVPTDYNVVNTMLSVAGVNKNDVLYDLGCGDGRIVIEAVKQRGVRKAVGIDIDPFRIRDSNANAAKEGLTGRVEFREADIFKSDYRDATVITMYLLDTIDVRLRPVFFETLKPGTRLVSNTFGMGDWDPDVTLWVTGEPGRPGHSVKFWVLPANISGDWTFAAGGLAHTLHVEQKYQVVSGTMTVNGAAQALSDMTLSGTQVQFSVRAPDGAVSRYHAAAEGEAMTGTIVSGETTIDWRAARTPKTMRTIITEPTPDDYSGS